MTHRFLLHSINHSLLVVDISQVGVASKFQPQTGIVEMVSALRFINWEEATLYFREKGADDETIRKSSAMLIKTSAAVMTIV